MSEWAQRSLLLLLIFVTGVGSANWLSVIKIHVKVSPKKYSALHIYFKPAAPEVGFTGYDMALMDQNGNIIQTKPVRVAWTKEVK